ncbi:MAG: acetyl-CoA C-acetyltransferase [Caulobacteraceae bacterium]
MGQAYIVDAVRTAGGRRGGKLSGWHPADLSGLVLDALVERAGADPALVEDVIWGCVSQGGEQGQNIGRNAVLASKLPESVPGVSVDRQCGSSQQAIHFAAQAVMSGAMDVVIAGGVESMSRVPMFSPVMNAVNAGQGDGYMSPRMQARYPNVMFSQFMGAEMLADKYAVQKDAMDAFALDSHRKAAAAIEAGAFEREIVAVDGHDRDEGVRFDASLEGIAGVKTLTEGGRISAANASQICDGAAAVMIVNEAGLKALGAEPLARIHQMTVVGGDPVVMLEEPLPGTARALAKAGLSIADIGLFEINEAFAPVPIAWLQTTGADPQRLNVNGGGIALGHPLGATGAKLMTTLVHGLRARDKRYGLQAMCEGGGMANVTIIERL